jgi:glucans biosynthesis protein C
MRALPTASRDGPDGSTTIAGTAARPAAAAPQASPSAAGRRAELDVIRALVVAGLVVFHSAVVFAAGASWFVKDPRPDAGFTVFLLWGSLWGMPLLFLVSGVGVRYALRTRSVAAFARERLTRLGLPFAAGLVVLVPPMFYLEHLGQRGFHQPYWRFWLSFVNLPALARGLLPRGAWTSGGVNYDPAHLWFLYVLLVYSLTLLPLFGYLRGPRGTRLTGQVAGFTGRHPALALSLAAIPIMAVEAAAGPDVNTGGWERLAYVFPFLYGYLIASDPRFEAALRRARRAALAVAAVATMGLVTWAGALNASGTGLGSGVPAGWGALQGLAGWAWIVAILGFAGALTARREKHPAISAPRTGRAGSPWRRAARYANQAVLPFYLLHEPVIVAAAWVIVRWHVPVPAQYATLVIVSLAATLTLYELAVRRYRLTRLLSGMKPLSKPAAAKGGEPAGASGGPGQNGLADADDDDDV